MSSLRSPLREHAPYPVDAGTTQRLWRGVVERLEARGGRGSRVQIFLWFACGAIVGVAFMLGVGRLPGKSVEAGRQAAALALADGGAFHAFEAPLGAPATGIPLADGSKVVLEPSTRLEPLENTGASLMLLLTDGRATFDVHPGGPRRWFIECGLATVEVVGTRFVITRSPARLLVEVERGTVLVRGERVPNRVQRLTAGSKIEVLESIATPATPAAVAAATPATSVPVPVPVSSNRAWRELATRGAFSDAYRALGVNGISREVTSSVTARDLMALADVARLSGHASEAVEPLTRVIGEHIDDPGAPLAAFTLGKIHLSTLGDAERAARDFSQAIALGLPSSLLEDAYAYLVEARLQAGDGEGAKAAAAAFQKRFPGNDRAEELMKSVLHR